MSIAQILNITTNVNGAVAAAFNLQATTHVASHTVTVSTSRVEGPFLSVADVTAAGFDSGTTPEINFAATEFFQNGGGEFQIGRIDVGDADIGASLAAIEAANGAAWTYAFTIESRVQADIELAATFAQARRLQFFGQTADAAVSDGTGGNVGEVLRLAAQDRSNLFIHLVGSGSVDGYLDVAAMSKMASFNLDIPGGRGVLHMKTLPGIIPDVWTAAQLANIYAENVNTYDLTKGLGTVLNNTSSAGAPLFIDIVPTVDWLEVRTEEAHAAFHNSVNVVPFNQAGLNQSAAIIQGVIDRGIANGLFLPPNENPEGSPYSLVIPNIRNISSLQKQTRTVAVTVNNLFFTGAIQSVSLVFNLEF